MNKLVLITLVALFAGALADNYAVLVAGSKGYSNYRHQSDVCHAYQTLLQKGYSAHNIIVFSYNDVAKSLSNPFRGQLFNKPSGKEAGVNVNEGCVIDYEGKHVTPANYLAVIQGQQNKVTGGTKRVLQSGPNDHVFLSFFDHGAPGLIAFPTTYLYASQLLAAFQNMFASNLYGRLVYYLEACESGSMFQDLPSNLNIYAVSAANATESSWAAYCGSQAVVKGKNIGSCLGDLFSVNWLENTDSLTVFDLSTYPLQEQYDVVANLTSLSEVLQWGDLTFTSEATGDFLTGSTDSSSVSKNFMNIFKFKSTPMTPKPVEGLMDSRKVTVQYFLNQFAATPTTENLEILTAELKSIEKFERKFTALAEEFGLSGQSNTLPTNFACYSSAIDMLEGSCGKIPDAQLGNLKYLYELCGRQTLVAINLQPFFNQIC